jgi:hypothetical protein
MAISGNSNSNKCFKVAMDIVKPKKNDDKRVNKPNIINRENKDSDKEAIKPKNVCRNFIPIKSVSTPPNLSHFSGPPIIFP